ncbi:11920_t:CDS:2, partial [Cetraspora pellucida]
SKKTTLTEKSSNDCSKVSPSIFNLVLRGRELSLNIADKSKSLGLTANEEFLIGTETALSFDDPASKLDIKATKEGVCDKCGREVSPEPKPGSYRDNGYDVLHKDTGQEEKLCRH